MLIFLPLLTIFALTTAANDPKRKISSPDYNKLWSGPLPKQREDFNVDEGYGVVILFREFLMGPNDCVIACLQNTINCTSLCGDPMDHPSVKKLLMTNGSATITADSTGTADGLKHAGFDGTIIPFDLSTRRYFDCDTTITITDDETFYFVSQNYPYTPTDSAECTVQFISDKAIRFALYDLTSNSMTDSFIISGPSMDGTLQTLSYSGKHVTDDEPFAVYFKNYANITFNFDPAHTYYTRGFYILVDGFNGERSVSDCNGIGAIQLTKDQVLKFGTKNSDMPYGNNLNCTMSYTNPYDDHRLFLAMAYESEKCCDTMEINGLATYEGIFQGQQGSYLYFAANNTVIMNFVSDGVVGGVGFSGSAQIIDCSCSSPTIKLQQETVLTSPGYSNSPTYCPSLNCEWQIEFDPEYEVHWTFEEISLRPALPDPDVLRIADQFNNTFKITTRDNTLPKSMTATSSPVIMTFSTSTTATFSPTLVYKGFSSKLNLVKKDFISKTVTFTDTYFMEDISTNLFENGPNSTFEFKIVARNGRKVSMYFFTNTAETAYVDIYDGSTTSSPMMNISRLLTVTEDGTADLITSSSSTVLIRIRANRDWLTVNNDFQAMVTDHVNGEDCASFVYTARNKNNMTDIKLSGQNCLNVLHVTDSSYDAHLLMSMRFDQKLPMNIYKGLSTMEDNLISSSSFSSKPVVYIPDRYVVLQSSTAVPIQLSYQWQIGRMITTETMGSDTEPGLLISFDFLPYVNVPALEEQFTIELLGSGKDLTGIRFEALAPLGGGKCNIQMEQYNDVLGKTTFTTKDGKFVYEECGTKMVIGYSVAEGSTKGLFAKFSRGTLKCSTSLVNGISVYTTIISTLTTYLLTSCN